MINRYYVVVKKQERTELITFFERSQKTENHYNFSIMNDEDLLIQSYGV
jgi:hypothetical protein